MNSIVSVEVYQLVAMLLTSSVIGAFISSLFTHWSALRLRKLDFRNDYYKELIKKRIEAYQYVEKHMQQLMLVRETSDGKSYHEFFETVPNNGDMGFQKDLVNSLGLSIWMDHATVEKLRSLNKLYHKISKLTYNKTESEIIIIAINHFVELRDLHFSITNSMRDGVVRLHDFKTYNKVWWKRLKNLISSK